MTRHINYIFITLVILIFSRQLTFSQDPVADILLPESSCLNEAFIPDPGSSTGDNYLWDFCEGDLLSNEVNISDLGRITGASELAGASLVYDGTVYWAFMTSRNNNILYRLNFGSDPENTPVIESLDNPGGLLSNPAKIAVFKSEGNWHGIVTNTDAQASLIHIFFGQDLSSISSVNSLGNFGSISQAYGLDHQVSAEKVTLFVLNRNTKSITEIDLSTDLSSTLDVRNYAISAVEFLRGIAVKNFRGKKYGTVISEGGEVFLLTYNNNSSTPDIQRLIYEEDQRLMDVEMFVENDSLIAMMMSRTGDLLQVNYGNDPDEFSPGINLGNYGQLPVIYQAFGWMKYQSKTIGLFLDIRINRVLRFVFENTCSASVDHSYARDPGPVSYSSSGMKIISLRASVESGLSNYTYDSLIVNRGPEIAFSSDGQCAGSPTQFTNQSKLDVGLSGLLWDFGDGTTSNTENPSHTYSAGGTYQVTLEITDDCGETQSMSQDIQIYSDNDLTADFTSPGIACTNSTNIFADNSTYTEDTPVSWKWLLNGNEVSTEMNALITFGAQGDQNITLEVTGTSGCISTVTKTVNVIEGPAPSFTVDDACQGTTMQFTNSSTGQVSSYLWDFGNGITSTLENPVIEYDQDGQYDVSLTLTNSAGCESTFIQQVTVYSLPEVSFTNELACERTTTIFRDESFAANANIVAWEWDFGDPDSEINQADTQEATHIFSAAGIYNVTLTVTTNFGCEASAVREVVVLESPTAAFSYDQACIGEPVQFQDNSFPPSGESLTSWAWDLGGTFSGQRNPTATFDFPLTYDVTLVVTASNQCIATETRQIVIPDPPDVRFDVIQPCLGSPVTFIDMTDTSSDPVVSRSWDFAGLGLASDSVSQFTFPNSGIFQVTLSLTLASGCTYQAVRPVQIDPAPVSSFTLDREFGPPPFVIRAQSTAQNAFTLQWLLDGAEIGTSPSLEYTLQSFGDYELALVASSQSGCRDTLTRMIQVTEPEIDVSVSDLQTGIDQNGIGEVTLSFVARNKGSVDLTTWPVTIVLDSDFEVSQQVEVMLPSDNSPVNITLPVRLNNRQPLNVCVVVPPVINGIPDSNPENNSVCLAGQPVVIYAPYPNPASDEVLMDVLSTRDEQVRIDVYTSTGTLKFSGVKTTGIRGLQQWVLDTSHWAAGTYILRAVTSRGTENYRFVIQR